jgi:prepilin-type N-terminal cleavage/methylation domain-containing protein
MRKHGGFTLVELMIAVVVFMFAIMAATGLFIPIVSQFKQQSKINESNIEGVVGLELLRGDLDQAGVGLPFSFNNVITNDTAINYAEAANDPAQKYNDAPGDAPRAIVAGNDVNFPNIAVGSDYLVIKSVLVAKSDTAHKWSSVTAMGMPKTRWWGDNNYDLTPDTDRVIVMNGARALVMDNTGFFTTYSKDNFPANFSPQQPATNPQEAYLIYGVDPTNDLKMPFNRADYYIRIPGAADQFPLPTRCAAGTGLLVKAVLSHTGVDFPAQNIIPLLDCVADMQVVFGLDMGSGAVGTDPNGLIGTYTNPNGSTIVGGPVETETTTQADVQKVLSSADEIRNRLMEIRVYVLAHEGQMDPNYSFTNFTGVCATCIRVGDSFGCGRDFDLSATGPDWQHYRWKLYTIVVRPQNVSNK